MRICSSCKIEQPLDEFAVAKGRAGGRSGTCKTCKRLIDKRYYKNNKDKVAIQKKVNRASSQEKLMKFLEENPCVDCGESDILVLEFDHRDGSPEVRVTQLVSHRRSWEKILEEISKCDVRCANCHSRITRQRANDWRWQYVSANISVV